jgi:acetyl-CoA acetyltransferase
MAWISGAGATPFGRLEGSTSLSLAAQAAQQALDDAGLARAAVDGLICGYSTTFPHMMPAGAFAEHFGLRPQFAQGVAMGGATGLGMTALAQQLTDAGVLRTVLVVAGENRLTGQSRDDSIRTLAQVGHPRYEVPLGANVPAYYALLASAYLHDRSATRADLAQLAVLMRANAGRHPEAHLRDPVTVADVLASRPIAEPLHLLDCCPISDGGAAVVVTARPVAKHSVRIRSSAQAHLHQHVTVADLRATGAGQAAGSALAQAGIRLADIDVAGVYDSFTVTLAMLLEEIGLARHGAAGRQAADGEFGSGGRVLLNADGGLLSHGHSGVAGGLAHLIETVRQLSGRAAGARARDARLGLVHAEGGVLSAHVSAVLERQDG